MNKACNIAATSFFLVCVLSCRGGNPERAIQLIVLQEMLESFAQQEQPSRVLISEMTADQDCSMSHYTMSSPLDKLLLESFPRIRRDTIDSYFQNNKTPQSIRSGFSLKKPYELVSQSTADEEEKKIASGRFDPGRCVARISRVGFSADGKQALVYIEFHFGPLAARGTFALVERNPDGWSPPEYGAWWMS